LLEVTREKKFLTDGSARFLAHLLTARLVFDQVDNSRGRIFDGGDEESVYAIFNLVTNAANISADSPISAFQLFSFFHDTVRR
jgi:hypothetical protein